MSLIKICQLRIEIVCRVKRGKFFLKIFLLFECKKVQFGPQNIIWGLKNGGWGARAPPPGSATGALPELPFLAPGINKYRCITTISIVWARCGSSHSISHAWINSIRYLQPWKNTCRQFAYWSRLTLICNHVTLSFFVDYNIGSVLFVFVGLFWQNFLIEDLSWGPFWGKKC